jgi:hypothetical protein
VAERVPPAAGILEALDAETCLVTFGAETLRALGVFIGGVGVDFTIEDPPELVDHVARMGERFLRAAAGGGGRLRGTGPGPLA